MLPRGTKLMVVAILVLFAAVAVAMAAPGHQARHQLGDVTLPEAPIDSPYAFQFETTLREPEPEFTVVAGDLPVGLALSPKGLLSGTPSAPGESAFTVRASNGVERDVEQALTLQVVGSPVIGLQGPGPITATTAVLSATVNPRNLPATAWFEYWPAADPPQTPVWTPVETIASGLDPVTVSTVVSGLEPDTEYLYRLSAHNDLEPAALRSETQSLRTTDSGLPPPVAGQSFNLEPVAGTTSTRCAGEEGFSRLTAPKQVTIDCQVDTTRGTVSLTASKGSSGETQTALFWGGLFGVTQKAGDNQKAVLGLAGRLRCEKRTSGRQRRVAMRGHAGGRKLWGSGSGNYKTVGSHGAATVRGTIWLVADRCDGSTHFKVKRGVVEVRDFVKQKTVILEAGDSYVAKVVGGRLP